MHLFHIDRLDADNFGGWAQLTEQLGQNDQRPSVIVASTLGSTGLTLEAVAEAYFSGKKEDALHAFQSVVDSHIDLLTDLPALEKSQAMSHLDEFRTEVEWLLHDRPVRSFEYYYDQILCVGALMSSVIQAAVLKHLGFKVQWIDARDIIRTDDQFRNASIDTGYTAQQVDNIIKPATKAHEYVVIQGGIGATDENESTTLGSKGIDLTMSTLAKCMDAGILSI